jgi:hypothetical protein
MKKLAVIAITLAAISTLCAVAKAADYYYQHFTPAKMDLLGMRPCASHGGIKASALSLDEDQVLVALFTCTDDQLVLATDMRPGSGTAVGQTSQNIRVQLDAPSGNVGSGFVMGGGWTFECSRRIVSVNVKVDGAPSDAAVVRGARPDVTAMSSCAGSDAGFTFWLNTGMLSSGSHEVQVQAADDQGKQNLSNALMVMVP